MSNHYDHLFGSYLKELSFWERFWYAHKREWYAGFLTIPTNQSIAIDKIFIKLQEKKRKRNKMTVDHRSETKKTK